MSDTSKTADAPAPSGPVVATPVVAAPVAESAFDPTTVPHPFAASGPNLTAPFPNPAVQTLPAEPETLTEPEFSQRLAAATSQQAPEGVKTVRVRIVKPVQFTAQDGSQVLFDQYGSNLSPPEPGVYNLPEEVAGHWFIKLHAENAPLAAAKPGAPPHMDLGAQMAARRQLWQQSQAGKAAEEQKKARQEEPKPAPTPAAMAAARPAVRPAAPVSATPPPPPPAEKK